MIAEAWVKIFELAERYVVAHEDLASAAKQIATHYRDGCSRDQDVAHMAAAIREAADYIATALRSD